MAQLGALIPLLIIFALFYFLIIRPQNKQQKKLQEMRDQMKEGDEVLTIGGFYGIVYAIDEKNVVLEMLPDYHRAMVVRNAISKVIQPEDSVIESEPEDSDEPDLDDNINIKVVDDYDDTDQLADDDNIDNDSDELADGDVEEIEVEAEPEEEETKEES